MKNLTDVFTMNNGEKIPCIGFGTWQAPDGAVVTDSVKSALAAGYRHIDTAAAYENEPGVGAAIAASGLLREEVFITSKLWNTQRGYDSTLRAFEESLKKLNTDYLDLYLIHWPEVASGSPEWQEINLATWRAFEKLYEEGRIKAIGLSNFLPHHMEPLFAQAKYLPMVNQIEYHPGVMQQKTVDFCHANQMIVEGWSPLGNGDVLKHPVLREIAARYQKSTAQVCIRWCLQHNVLPLPKSVNAKRIEENADVFDFVISNEDMQTIDALPYIGGPNLDPDTLWIS